MFGDVLLWKDLSALGLWAGSEHVLTRNVLMIESTSIYRDSLVCMACSATIV